MTRKSNDDHQREPTEKCCAMAYHADGWDGGFVALSVDLDESQFSVTELWSESLGKAATNRLTACAAVAMVFRCCEHNPSDDSTAFETVERIAQGTYAAADAWEHIDGDTAEVERVDLWLAIEVVQSARTGELSTQLAVDAPDGFDLSELPSVAACFANYFRSHQDRSVADEVARAYERLAALAKNAASDGSEFSEEVTHEMLLEATA